MTIIRPRPAINALSDIERCSAFVEMRIDVVPFGLTLIGRRITNTPIGNMFADSHGNAIIVGAKRILHVAPSVYGA